MIIKAKYGCKHKEEQDQALEMFKECKAMAKNQTEKEKKKKLERLRINKGLVFCFGECISFVRRKK